MFKKIITIITLLMAIPVYAINLVFRLDDPKISADSITMRVLRMFNEKHIPLSIAVIPCDSNEFPFEVTDTIYLAMLQSSNVEIVLHGFNHDQINQCGEFGSIDSIETERRISTGKTILESKLRKDLITFVPPFNAFNDHTLEAMLDNGFSILSADMYSYIYRDGIQYYSETLGHLMHQKGMWQAASDAIFACMEKDAICVVMFHAYDLPDEASWEQLANLIDACSTDKDVQLHTFRSLYESGNLSSQHRYKANQMNSLLKKYLLHPGVLHTTWLCWFVHVLNALIYAVLPLLSVVIGRSVLMRKKMPLSKLVVVLAILLSVVFGVLVFLQTGGPLKLLAVDFAVSVCLTLGLLLRKR